MLPLMSTTSSTTFVCSACVGTAARRRRRKARSAPDGLVDRKRACELRGRAASSPELRAYRPQSAGVKLQQTGTAPAKPARSRYQPGSYPDDHATTTAWPCRLTALRHARPAARMRSRGEASAARGKAHRDASPFTRLVCYQSAAPSGRSDTSSSSVAAPGNTRPSCPSSRRTYLATPSAPPASGCRAMK